MIKQNIVLYVYDVCVPHLLISVEIVLNRMSDVPSYQANTNTCWEFEQKDNEGLVNDGGSDKHGCKENK